MPIESDSKSASAPRHVLMLLPDVPYPAINGGKRAHYANLLQLDSHVDILKVILANMDTSKSDVKIFCQNHSDLDLTVIDIKNPSRIDSKWKKSWSKIKSWFSPYPQIYSWLNNSQAVMASKAAIASGKYTHVWVDQLSAMALLPSDVDIPLILSTQNVESELSKDIYMSSKPWTPRRLKRWIDWKKMQRLEFSLLKRADCVVCISDHDALLLEKRLGVKTSHVMVPKLFHPLSKWRPSAQKSLLFVGQTTHLPNKDAIDWIVKILAPSLYKRCPDIRIDIVGSEGSEYSDLALAPSLRFHGKVTADQLEGLSTHCTAALCPVVLGSGIKIKVLEAASNGVPVIATRESLQGLSMLTDCLLIDRSDAQSATELIVRWVGDQDRLEKASAENIKSLILQYQVSSHRLSDLFDIARAKKYGLSN